MAEMTRSISSMATPTADNGGAPSPSDSSERHFSRALRNVLWLSSGSTLSRILSLARSIILARLLTPFDFGVYGLSGSIVGVKERLADIGAGNFLVYRPEEIEQHVETTFWVNLGLSSVLLALLAAAAPVLARIYRQPLLTPVLVLMGLGVWARANASIHQNLLRIQSRFRAIAIIDNCSSLAWLAVAVGLAWKGFGVWALVVSALAANVIWAALLIVTQGWKPRLRIAKSSFRLLRVFSFWYVGQGLAWYLMTNLDNLMVGRFLGMTLLGIYALAFNYALLPVTLLGNAMGNVAFAELPKLYNRPEAFWSAYLEFSRVSALVCCFMAFAAVVAAPDIFPVIFGHKWDASILPFQILSLYAAVRCLWLDPFLALGEFRLSCLIGIASLALGVAAIGLGLRYGLAGVACAMLVTQISFNVVSLRVTARSWRPLLNTARATLPYLAGGMAAAALSLGFRHFVLSGRLELKVAITAATVGVFLCLYGFLFRSDLTAVLSQMLHRQTPRIQQ
jgi:O-antigen/teichoic acid export membrane protein